MKITEEQKLQIHDLVFAKYGEEKYNQWNEGDLIIHDKEISNIVGVAVYKVPVGNTSPQKAKELLRELMQADSKVDKDKYKTYEIPTFNTNKDRHFVDKKTFIVSSIDEDVWIPMPPMHHK